MINGVESEVLRGLGQDLPHYRTRQNPIELNKRLLADIEKRRPWNRKRAAEIIVFEPLVIGKTA